MANITPANLGAVADPRLSAEPDAIGSYQYDKNTGKPMYPANRSDNLHNPSVSFEEYHFYANIEREYEKTLDTSTYGLAPIFSVAIGRVGKNRKQDHDIRTGQTAPAPRQLSEKNDDHVSRQDEPSDVSSSTSDPDRKTATGDFAEGQHESAQPVISEAEWHTASRAARTATWGAVFYLITTDILGPFSVPWALSQLGYGPGAALYTIFGIMAFYSGTQLWRQFLGLDSEKYPIKSYGDLAYRIYGSWGRHICNVLQSLQFFLNVTLLIVSNGQGIAQLAVGPSGTGFLCFVAAEVIFAGAGFVLGQIRTLQRFSYVANIAVWLNVFVIFMTMVITNTSKPNWSAVTASYSIVKGPIYHSAGTPPGKNIVDQVNGLMQAVYSYGGATLFNELMAEMRRPNDFWKGLIAADAFIFTCYIVFGMVVYSAQGQATFNPAYQGINTYAWQTVGNIFTLVSGLIAACLYGNIGIKVLYANVGRSVLHFPPLESKKGKWIWVAFVPLYWGLAFILAAAVPTISYLGSFVGAAMILQFTYTFPPILMVGYNVLKDGMLPEERFVPATGEVHRVDGGFQRIWRGYKKHLFRNLFDTIYFLGACTAGVLGIYASIVGMIQQFGGNNNVQSFSCANPAGG